MKKARKMFKKICFTSLLFFYQNIYASHEPCIAIYPTPPECLHDEVDDQRVAIDALLDGLHQDAHEGNFQTYFVRYSPDAVFLGTDKTERWTIEEFKTYAKPAFADGHGWTYAIVERNWEGDGNTRWFDEILFNEKLGHCRGTGVVQLIKGEWKITHYSLTMLVPNAIAADIGTQTREADKP